MRSTVAPAQLSDIDARLLEALSLDARARYSDLAQLLGITRQAVRYHLDQLEARGVLEGTYVMLNIAKLGYLYHRVLLQLVNLSPTAEKRVIDYFVEHPSVGWVVEQEGEWDLALAVWTRSMVAFETFVDDMHDELSDHIGETRVSLSSRIHHLKSGFLTNVPGKQALVVGGELDHVTLDATDYEILQILARDGRRTHAEIANSLGLSAKVVRYRLNRLHEQNVILGFNIRVNHAQLGLTQHKVLLQLVGITHEKRQNLIDYLTDQSAVVCITRAIGFSDLEFEVIVRSNDEFSDVLRALRYSFPEMIRDVSSFVISRESYINYLPGLPGLPG